MSAKKKMRLTFFYADRDLYEIAKAIKPHRAAQVGLAPSSQATNEKEMIDWANKFYDKYGYELDFIPNTALKTKNDEFILQEKDGINPRMFDKTTHDKFEQERVNLNSKRNRISKDKTKEIAEVDKKIAEATKRMGTTLDDYITDIQVLRLKCNENFIGGNIRGKRERGEKQNQIPNRLAVIFCQFDYSSVQSNNGTVAETFGTSGRSIPICSYYSTTSCTPFIVIDIENCVIGTLAHEIAHAGAMMRDLDDDQKKTSKDSIMNYDNLGKNTNPKNLKLQSSLKEDSETLCKDRLKTAFFLI